MSSIYNNHSLDFHKSTSYTINNFQEKAPNMQEFIKLHTKATPSSSIGIKLPNKDISLDMSLAETLKTRRTSYSVKAEISLQELASLFHYSFGVSAQEILEGFNVPIKKRTYPSGGPTFPIRILFYAHNVLELKRGIYEYFPISNSIKLLKEVNDKSEVSYMDIYIQGDGIDKEAAIHIFLVGDFKKQELVYKHRSYRLMLKESGHMAQNLLLVANALGLNIFPCDSYFDDTTDQFITIDSEFSNQSTLYVLLAGKDHLSM